MNSFAAWARTCAAIVLLQAGFAAGAAGPDWVLDPDEAFRRSEATGKPVVVDVFADWCQPCHEMERTTWADPRVVAALDGFVALKLDSDRYESLSDRYRVDTLPTTLVLDSDGRPILSIPGLTGPSSILQTLSTVEREYDRYREWIAQPDDVRSMEQVGDFLYRAGSPGSAARAFGRAADLARDSGEPASRVEAIELKQAQTTFAGGDHRGGIALLARLSESATDPRVESWALAGLVETRRAVGDRAGAETALARLRTEYPDVARQLESASK